MEPQDVLNRINSLIQQIAVEIMAVVDAADPQWTLTQMSVKWVGDSGVCDVVIESSSGSGNSKYHFPSMDTYNNLMLLWSNNRLLKRPWNELLLTIGSDGACKIQFAYDDVKAS